MGQREARYDDPVGRRAKRLRAMGRGAHAESDALPLGKDRCARPQALQAAGLRRRPNERRPAKLRCRPARVNPNRPCAVLARRRGGSRRGQNRAALTPIRIGRALGRSSALAQAGRRAGQRRLWAAGRGHASDQPAGDGLLGAYGRPAFSRLARCAAAKFDARLTQGSAT